MCVMANARLLSLQTLGVVPFPGEGGGGWKREKGDELKEKM